MITAIIQYANNNRKNCACNLACQLDLLEITPAGIFTSATPVVGKKKEVSPARRGKTATKSRRPKRGKKTKGKKERRKEKQKKKEKEKRKKEKKSPVKENRIRGWNANWDGELTLMLGGLKWPLRCRSRWYFIYWLI